MKTYLSFNDQSEDDREKLKTMLQATNMSIALFNMSNELFRPARKHGYRDNPRLNELLENEQVAEAIELLEKLYHEILNESGATVD